MKNTLSVAQEHRESFKVFYAAALAHVSNNQKIVSNNFRKFKTAIEQPLLQMTADKLNTLFGDEYMNQVMIDFEFFPYASIANSGGTDFCFDDNPELSITINFNKNLRALYKKDIRLFCLTLADIFTHELIHGIQYIKQYQSIGIKEELLKESIFKNREHLFKLDPRYTIGEYYEDLPYFSKHEELTCYAKDAARQLLTVYKDKNIVISKLSNVSELKDLSEASDCFYYYYDCFYARIPELKQYQLLWKSFTKRLYHNLHEQFEI